eukprot:1158086-Pelagomonas_calceolata.AAC.8
MWLTVAIGAAVAARRKGRMGTSYQDSNVTSSPVAEAEVRDALLAWCAVHPGVDQAQVHASLDMLSADLAAADGQATRSLRLAAAAVHKCPHSAPASFGAPFCPEIWALMLQVLQFLGLLSRAKLQLIQVTGSFAFFNDSLAPTPTTRELHPAFECSFHARRSKIQQYRTLVLNMLNQQGCDVTSPRRARLASAALAASPAYAAASLRISSPYAPAQSRRTLLSGPPIGKRKRSGKSTRFKQPRA